jgi:hypothetical protein
MAVLKLACNPAKDAPEWVMVAALAPLFSTRLPPLPAIV